MVRAILDGRKTQTRRVMNYMARPYPYGQPGDLLWVRETWADTSRECPTCPVSYRATWPRDDEDGRCFDWKPSIFMPRAFSRITLEIVSVRIEQLQDISEEDANAEGVDEPGIYQGFSDGLFMLQTTQDEPEDELTYRDGFAWLWDSINAKRGIGWDTNPWVWAIEFRMVKP